MHPQSPYLHHVKPVGPCWEAVQTNGQFTCICFTGPIGCLGKLNQLSKIHRFYANNLHFMATSRSLNPRPSFITTVRQSFVAPTPFSKAWAPGLLAAFTTPRNPYTGLCFSYNREKFLQASLLTDWMTGLGSPRCRVPAPDAGLLQDRGMSQSLLISSAIGLTLANDVVCKAQ